MRFRSSLEELSLDGAIFMDPFHPNTDSNRWPHGLYKPDWNAFFAAHPGLTKLQLGNSNLGGTLPESLPTNMTNFEVSNAALSGTIPPTLLSRMSLNLDHLVINLAQNDLSGPIGNLAHSLVSPSVRSISLDFSRNKLSGSLPPNMFEGANMTELGVLTLSFAKNHLEGPIPPTLFGDVLPTLWTLIFSFADNFLSGTIPPDLVKSMDSASKALLSMRLEGNQLRGDLPLSSLLACTSNGNSLESIHLDVSRNHLNGTVPSAIVPNNAQLAKSTITILADFNNLTGALASSMLAIPTSSELRVTLSFANNRISGPIPTDWLSGVTSNWKSLQLNFDHNQLEGSPFTDALSLPPVAALDSFILSYKSNKLIATFPSDFCAQCFAEIVAIDLFGNQISGSLPSGLFTALNTRAKEVDLRLGSNRISGFSSNSFLSALNSPSGTLLMIRLDLQKNGLIGSLDFSLFEGVVLPTGSAFSLSLASNSFVGPLTATFLSDIPSQITQFTLNLDHNRLSEAGNFLTPVFSVWRSAVDISLVNCSLVGNFDGLGWTSTVLASVTLRIDHNSLTGIFPLTTLLSQMNDSGPTSLTVSASHNKFDGTLTFDHILDYVPNLFLNLSSNKLSSWAIHPEAPKYIKQLDVSNNLNLQGTIPAGLFDYGISSFAASHTSLTGLAPTFNYTTPSFLVAFYLNNTAIDFCSSASGRFPQTVAKCSMHNTTATNCARAYHYSCLETSETSLACDPATKPSDQFICVGGIWVTNTPVTTPVLTIPGGATQTVVNANVSTSIIVFNGLDSTLTINGCINNLTKIQVALTLADLEKLGSSGLTKVLLQYSSGNGSCNNDLSSVVVSTSSPDSCKKVKAKTVDANGTLSGIFTIDSSKCNAWWIILVSVIAAVVVIAVIVFVLLVVFVPSVRQKVRPYSKKRSETSTLA